MLIQEYKVRTTIQNSFVLCGASACSQYASAKMWSNLFSHMRVKSGRFLAFELMVFLEKLASFSVSRGAPGTVMGGFPVVQGTVYPCPNACGPLIKLDPIWERVSPDCLY